jgi:hypothetical protein
MARATYKQILSLYTIFNYILKILYLGCQWKELPIHKDGEGQPETHYTRFYRIWRRWVDNACMDAIFAGSVSKLHKDGRLDTVGGAAGNEVVVASARLQADAKNEGVALHSAKACLDPPNMPHTKRRIAISTWSCRGSARGCSSDDPRRRREKADVIGGAGHHALRGRDESLS